MITCVEQLLKLGAPAVGQARAPRFGDAPRDGNSDNDRLIYRSDGLALGIESLLPVALR